MNASKFGRFEDEMIGLPNDISIKSRSISFPLGMQKTAWGGEGQFEPPGTGGVNKELILEV